MSKNCLTHSIGGRTHFSLGQSILPPNGIIEELMGVGIKSITIGDFNSVNALPLLYKTAKNLKKELPDLKINFSAIVKVVDDISWRKPKKGEKRTFNNFFSPRLIAKNDEGVKDIMRLLSLANSETHFYGSPQIELEDLIDTVNYGNIFLSTGDIDSLFAHANYKAIIVQLCRSLRENTILFELIPVKTAYYDKLNEITLQVADKLDVRIIVTRPIYYSSNMDRARNIMYCASNHATINSTWRSEPQTSNLHPLVKEDMENELVALRERLVRRGSLDNNDVAFAINQAIKSTNDLSDELDYEWKPYDISLPKMSDNPFETLVKISKEGWANRLEKKVYGYQPDTVQLAEYRQRLKYELSVLRNMGFEDYFLLVHKVVHQAKAMGIMVGPGRGSVGGSLIAFLMGITDVDPIRFGLIFERFINPDRLDLPDADLDFMSSRREDIMEWLVKEYGQEYVCGISNYGVLGSASALRYAGKVHDLFPSDYSCSKLVPKEHGSSKTLSEAKEEVAAIKIFSDKYPEVWRDAENLQGIFNIYGQHAAGVVVAGTPIVEHAVFERRKERLVCNWDKSVVEDFGLVKLDVLGLSNLDVLRLAKDYIQERHGTIVDYEDVPLDDEAVLKSFAEGTTNAIFQFESGGMKALLKSLAEYDKLTFDDLSAATALYRPGPMDAGLLDQYVSIKQGNRSVEFPHDICKPALEETYGVMVFQEQVMQIARDLSGFSMSEADTLRKAIGKKDAKLMGSMGEKFIQGATDSGMLESSAESLWNDILGFAAYSFNKSHSVAYTLISYLTMWLKVKYPAEFYAASMTILKEEKLPGIVRDCGRANIKIVPPDINLSTDRFEIGYDDQNKCHTLIIPFQRLKGLSVKANDAIMAARSKRVKEKGDCTFESKEDFLSYVQKRTCNIRVQAALDSVGAFAAIEDQIPVNHPDRVKDQKTLLPGLISEDVKADRKMNMTPFVRKQLIDLIATTKGCCPEFKAEKVVEPYYATTQSPKYMVITDSPNWQEKESGKMLGAKADGEVVIALKEAGLRKSDGYFTSLSKMSKPKGEKSLPQAMMINFGPILTREIEILKPPVIVALGTAAARFLLPDLKGGWEEIANTTHYDASRDCTVVIGCNPAMLYFDPDRINIILEAFEATRAIIE